jgi:truncated hemoglobin YjbI
MLTRFVHFTLQLAVGRQFSLAFLFLVTCLTTVRGAEPDEQLFTAQLASGEFAPALETANSLADPSERDAWLARLSEAQAAIGGHEQALHSLLAVSDDRIRSTAIKRARELTGRGAGGGTQADFDSLIDLIVNTVRPTTWDEVGGPGSISEFRNGVFVDPAGVLRRAVKVQRPQGLATARLAAVDRKRNSNPQTASGLRKISLTRLEKHVQLALAAGRSLDDSMRNLAGLERIQFVFVYPESGELVLAGPAGPWQLDAEGRSVSVNSGRPIVQLDDLVVLLRHSRNSPRATFGCSINPTEQGLAGTRAVASSTHGTPLKPSQRAAWLKELRDAMGLQDIVVDGIGAQTHVARVIVAADYHMKLIGMGLEAGIAEVPSYLDLIQVKAGESPPPLDVLRWWFTMNYEALVASENRDAFEIRGQGVQVLSENELLTQLGKRVPTGAATLTNQQFAGNFTTHFALLAEKYPVYADLQNVFDLALVAALIQQEQLADRVGWHLTCFGSPDDYAVDVGPAPRQVETVINHRKVGGRYLVVGVSGGVHAEPWKFVSTEKLRTDKKGTLAARRASYEAPKGLALDRWWWD